MVYLTIYEEYPIYEPAEGGYYYAGLAVVKSERMSKRKAKREFDKLAEELIKETKDDKYPWIKLGTQGRQLVKDSYHIGEGSYICIENKQGKHSQGWHPYC